MLGHRRFEHLNRLGVARDVSQRAAQSDYRSAALFSAQPEGQRPLVLGNRLRLFALCVMRARLCVPARTGGHVDQARVARPTRTPAVTAEQTPMTSAAAMPIKIEIGSGFSPFQYLSARYTATLNAP